MNAEDLKKRTKQFGLHVMKLTDSLPFKRSANAIGNQLIRSGTSVGANYRSACRGRSKPDFISKASIAIEEADEIIAILTASVKTARANLAQLQK